MHSLAGLLAAGRIGMGAAFLAFPDGSLRMLGVDRASAARTAWLARMTAARDVALGVGVLGAAVTRRGRVPALVVTALADATDAVVLATAARERRVDRLRGCLAAGFGGAAALAGFAAAADLFTGRGRPARSRGQEQGA
jgi:hypothetical protein